MDSGGGTSGSLASSLGTSRMVGGTMPTFIPPFSSLIFWIHLRGGPNICPNFLKLVFALLEIQVAYIDLMEESSLLGLAKDEAHKKGWGWVICNLHLKNLWGFVCLHSLELGLVDDINFLTMAPTLALSITSLLESRATSLAISFFLSSMTLFYWRLPNTLLKAISPLRSPFS